MLLVLSNLGVIKYNQLGIKLNCHYKIYTVKNKIKSLLKKLALLASLISGCVPLGQFSTCMF